jgi:hypothetical protein
VNYPILLGTDLHCPAHAIALSLVGMHLPRSIILLIEQQGYDAVTRQIAITAFDGAWVRIEASGRTRVADFKSDATQRKLLQRIFETLAKGESDPKRLADDAVNYLTWKRL